jgi:O-antigen/teichoic acid export membrane protein
LTDPAASKPEKRGDVLGNTLILIVAQIAGTPLSILSATMMGRYLGPEALGYIYIAMTLAQFGFLLVECGVSGVLPAAIAKDRTQAGLFVGSSLIWKVAAGPAITLLLTFGCMLWGQDATFLNVYWLISLQVLLGSFSGTLQDGVRGFERTELIAYAQVGGQLLSVIFVVSTLVLGGNMYAALAAQALTNALVLPLVWRSAFRIIPGSVSFDLGTVKNLLKLGTPFLIVALSNTMQGNVDAVYMANLATPEVVGWHAAARRLIGVLIMPAAALITALYPTLSRLHHEDIDEYRRTTAKAIRGTAILAMPIALCCGIYREVGVSLYGKAGFGRTEQNLAVLSLFIFLVYFSMPLGSAILAAGKQRAWAWVQLICVLVSLVLDPILIPWFQEHYQNGGLGICVATVLSEVPVVVGGLLLLPRGSLGKPVVFSLLRVGVAAGGFVLAARVLKDLTPFLAAPVALGAYVGTLWLIGPEERAQIQSALQRVLGKFLRRFSPSS